MKKKVLVILSSLMVAAYGAPDTIITGNMTGLGYTTRTEVVGSKVTITGCEKYTIHEKGKKCRATWTREYPSKEVFMQAAYYTLINGGSTDKEIQKHVELAKKVKSEGWFRYKYSNTEKELEKVKSEVEAKEKYFAQFGETFDSRRATELRERKLKLEERLKQKAKDIAVSKEGEKSIKLLQNHVRELYQSIADEGQHFMVKNSDFENDLIDKMVYTSETIDLSQGRFEPMRNLNAIQILSQSCKMDGRTQSFKDGKSNKSVVRKSLVSGTYVVRDDLAQMMIDKGFESAFETYSSGGLKRTTLKSLNDYLMYNPSPCSTQYTYDQYTGVENVDSFKPSFVSIASKDLAPVESTQITQLSVDQSDRNIKKSVKGRLRGFSSLFKRTRVTKK